ncbi:MAG TPA: tryptophan--tRNA ligase [Candidatus Margulisbacteria bacterium]|nr:MAG: tryptophan--tRNA ligase [Candidatus Margulisbacteria bacterium GWD2_39_127]OGI00894.1 MAG: tryptophan--tRNA ligase [Candidatus Margulisbacteria bacterium GWF2_38_17]OGI08749.1 MAG: tryptophan--tRNA ligase [Candidatus Margulisbacteria bacterium GWE2_39_32]HAR63486.1 tryptophan--tRNA ligase [Candidatus Margulisiibacteriota bacterium]HCT86064.1 tryptophan--tRNA ligase [Candidatus Margulisiibacteriota bacterium]
MRILSGIQPSGPLHIGNYFGMMKKMIQYQETSQLLCFIANYHALTSISNSTLLAENTLEAAISFLALGLDPNKSIFWVQSDIPEVTELTWVLANITPVGLMERSHSYKDKIAKGLAPNMGLFNYPILMASDILLYQSEKVPVGKDQKQHVEITRDIAIRFNNEYGDIFTIPEPEIDENVATIPGIDGQKMSKSYNNTIEIFTDKATLKTKVMNIVTDSLPVDASKDPDKCNVFNIYKLFIPTEEEAILRNRYINGGLKYSEVKKELVEIIWNFYAPYREKYEDLKAHPEVVRTILKTGEKRAREIAQPTIEKVKKSIGLRY